MTVEDAYVIYLNKSDKNITNDNVATDRGRFCILWNDKQIRYYRNLLQQKGLDDIRYAETFLKSLRLADPEKKLETFNFTLPNDFFDLGNIRAKASKDKCKKQEIYLYETSPENYTEKLRDVNTSPSFLWRESLFTLSSNNISIFYNDFEIDELLLSYYRYPKNIEQLDKDNPESLFNEDIKIEWDDKSIYAILDLCVLEQDISTNSNRINADALRLNN